GREDPARDLAPVGHEEAPDRHGRNTPNPCPPVQLVLSMTDRQSPVTVRVSCGSITPSSYSIPERKNGRLSSSTDASTSSRMPRSPSSSYSLPRASAAARETIESTPASWAGPITADFADGQVNRNRGS